MIYEYKCNSCGSIQEVWQKMSDPAPEECKDCHSKGSLERIISNTNFALKGSGWYTTDYKKSDSKNSKTETAPACAATPCGQGACGVKAEA